MYVHAKSTVNFIDSLTEITRKSLYEDPATVLLEDKLFYAGYFIEGR